MSLSASAVILLTALLRRFAADRLPRRMYIALWDVALLASIVPFRVPWEALSRLIRRMKVTVSQTDGAMFSVPTQAPQLAQGTTVSVPQSVTTAIPTVAPTAVAGSGIRDSLTQAVQPLRETVRSAPSWLWQALGACWMIGAVVLACVLAYRWFSCRRAFSEALPCEDERAVAFFREHRLLRRVRVRVSGRIASPLSYGLLHPVILLPASMAGADDQTVRYVLTHEFMHIRAWDMLRKSALFLALCLHWFSPLAWVMLRLCNRDMELMCDERVVRHLGGRKAYCLTLLDMEVRRSNLTMGTCFSVTGIEERIKVMKNRKHQGILSIVLAFAIILGATVGAMTGMPLADAEGTSPRMIFSRETWEGTYAKYAVYGLGYDEKNGTITYHGQAVRYFEDMWPIDETGKAGACFVYEGGAVDVYGVREFDEVIRRNPDGSFDPSGTLVGLRQATQEEYDAMTRWLEGGNVSQTTAVMQVAAETASIVATVTPMPTGDPNETPSPVPTGDLNETPSPMPTDDPNATPGPTTYVMSSSVPTDDPNETPSPMPAFIVGVPYGEVEWWTAEEYRAWMEEERIALQQLVEEQARAWTPSKGWFTWTQEEADAAMAQYESTLQAIEEGALVSKPIDGQDGVIFFSSADDVPPVELVAVDAETMVEEMTLHFAVTQHDGQTVLYGLEPDLGSDAEGKVVLVAVSPDDAWRYTPEEWAQIQEWIDMGLIQYQEPATAQQGMTDRTYQLSRMEEWRKTIAPYAPFGLTCELDAEMDTVRLYWNGKEVRGVFDPERGMWITEHSGNGSYPEGARELIAVYENGALVGLREATDEENAVWDGLRGGNK